MKKLSWKVISALFLTLLLVSGEDLLAAAPVDGQNIPVEYGFKSLSSDALDSGQILLFDGRSFFAWEAETVNPTRPENLPDPSIKIANGIMTITTSIPLKIRTPLLWTANTNILVSYSCQKNPNDKNSSSLIKPQLLDANKKPINLPYTKEWSISQEDKERSTKFNQKFDILNIQKSSAQRVFWFELTFSAGTYLVESIIYQPGKMTDLMTTDRSFRQPAGEMKLEKTEKSVRLSGKGHLETEALYKDFIAQVKFQTKVDLLKKAETFCNSGFFFRSIPESNLDGYECQINNAPNDIDRTKFLGNDTGSIFRRVAARRITDKDNEPTWMTILANGRTIRTWVNGVPTVCWNDERKPDPNPRKGQKTAEGSVQIQGHDPWTKIEFSQFKIGNN